MKIDLNCDMGESFGRYRLGEDETIIAHITSANIACGFHAGDPLVMAKTVALAKANGVAVGAHPGYPDLMGFGRRRLDTAPGEVKNYLIYQIGALAAFAKAEGVGLQHVKPHGALYNLAARDERIAEEVIAAVKAVDPGLILMALAGSTLVRMAEAAGLRVAAEAFPDRAYAADGQLAARSLPGAVIHDEAAVAQRVLRLVKTGTLVSIEGKEITLHADTLCIHGDTPGAWKLAKAIGETLRAEGVAITALGQGLDR